MAKIGITIDDELLARLDSYADEMFTSRSGFISFSVTQCINTLEVSSAFKDLSFAIRKIADTGTVDDDTLTKIEDFEKLAKLISFDFQR